jgi:hypothetical protein
MLAYNRDRLNAWINGRMIEDTADMGLITPDEKLNILNRYPSGFFNPKTIVRIGLGFATAIACSMFTSLVGLILFSENGVILFAIGAIYLIILEHLISKRLHYRSGIDDMLLFQAYGLLLGACMLFFKSVDSPELIISATGTVLAAFATIRYADRIMAFCALVGLIIFTGFLADRINKDFNIYLPFVFFMISLLTWYISRKLSFRPALVHYRHCLEFLQVTALVMAALFSNYYFVREIWLELVVSKTPEPSFWKWFYIVMTILLPLVTIITGFTGKDKVRIRIGALMVVAGIMTFHFYMISPPNEVLCIIYGSVLLIISYILLKHYKAHKDGISFQDKGDPGKFNELESLLVGAGVGLIIHEPAPGRFGGGSFGGAGSGGEF